MAIFLQILGSNLFILWAMSKVLNNKVLDIIPAPYGELYLKYNWVLLIVGLSLVGFSQILKLKKRRNSRTSHLSNDLVINKSKEKNQKNRANSYSEAQQTHKINNINYKSEAHKAVAMKVDWSPLVGGGSNFKTKSLHQEDDSRLVIKSSTGGKFFSLLFIVMGIGIPGIIGLMDYKDNGFEWSLLIPFLVGLIFAGVGILMLFFPRSRYIDKRLGWFWAGKKAPAGERALRQAKIASPLKELVALQIISERISSKNGSYTSWELNLVDNDATRYSVMDHGDNQSLLNDAQIISEFLSIPIWDNT